MSFSICVACKFLDYPPGNLRNLQGRLSKNSLAIPILELIIVYLDAIAVKNAVTLIDVTDQSDADLSSFDRISFASGIYFSSFAKQLLAFADSHLLESKDVFYIYTHGAPVGGAPVGSLLKGIRKIAKKRQCREIGVYHCLGFDTFGPFKLVGGVAKGHRQLFQLLQALRHRVCTAPFSCGHWRRFSDNLSLMPTGACRVTIADALYEVLAPLAQVSGYVLPGRGGKPVSEPTFRRLWKSIGEHMELYGATPINFRTTFATMAVASGVDIRTTQSLMKDF